MKKGILLFIALLSLFLTFPATAAIPSSSQDLWDLQSGVVVTANTPSLDNGSIGMLGGNGYAGEPGTTIFQDVGAGGVAFIEFKTTTSVAVNKIRIFTSGDGGGTFRAFTQFRLKIKSAGSGTFDQTVYTWTPTLPFSILDSSSYLVLDADINPVTTSEFRAEFVQGSGGVRVMELDALGAPSPKPAVTQDPQPTSAYKGDSAEFSVTATGETPLTYTWKHEGTNVVLSERITSSDGKSLKISNLTVEDAGDYKVVVSNQAGNAESAAAHLTVIVDTNAPLITINSPAAGAVKGSPVILSGFVSDDYKVDSARWELNGVPKGALSILGDGSFSTTAGLAPGESHLKVFAKDAAGNETSQEVVVSLSPTATSSDDLWDLSRGTTVTSISPNYGAVTGVGMFGGDGYGGEPGSTIFSNNNPDGFIHSVEWMTAAPVTVSTVRIFAGGDGAQFNNEREFARFTLKTKSAGSTSFDTTVFSWAPPHPYVWLDEVTALVLETNVPAFTAQEFRAEIEHINLSPGNFNGPRVLELDAFGPASGGGPQIVNQPTAREGFSGASASFQVGAIGAAPLVYQWRHAGTNLTESGRYVGVNSWKLTIHDLTSDDAGNYSVVVTNGIDQATSADAALTVNIDNTAPVITITSPLAGTQESNAFVLEGTVQEANELGSVTWQLNGADMGALAISSGQFRLAGLKFKAGENRIKVIARDLSGNEGSAEVVATWVVPRALELGRPDPVQEGSRVRVPVTLVSTGGVGGLTFVIGFSSEYVAEPQLEWSDGAVSGLTSATLDSFGRSIRATFILSGSTLPSGSVQLATLTFRARSVGGNISAPLSLSLADISSGDGTPYTTGNTTQGTSASITKRKIIGDNNANDRLDVGDASVILRLVTRGEIPRPWDTGLNDLNKSLSLDSGDAIKVLRAVVGLDPQPTVPAALPPDAGMGFAALTLPDGMDLVADKTTTVAGEKVTLEVRLRNQTKAISGASFRLEYPVNALRLENSTAHQTGAIVPAGSTPLWNLTPNQDYAAQNGSISLAVTHPLAWPNNNGTLAKFTFTVQAGAAGRFLWPVQLKNLEVTTDNGFATQLVGSGTWNFYGHEAEASEFARAISFDPNGAAQLILSGDIGASYLVEASNDLVHWSEVGVYDCDDGTVEVSDAEAANAPGNARFYKATLVTP